MKRIAGASIPAMILLLCLAAQVAFSAQVKQQRLNLTLKAVSFPEAIRQLFAGSKEHYSVDAALRNLKVTATLKNTVRDQAIKVVCGTAGVVYKVEKGTYYFSPRPTAVSVSGEVPVPAPPRGPTKTELIMLRCVSAADAAALLNASPPDGLLSITATNADALMIKGDQNAIDQARKMIMLFDVEDALPRSVRVTLSLKINSGGLAKPINLVSQSVGLEGSQMPLGINSSGEKSGSIMLDAKLTPTVGSNGSISLVGSGAIDCSVPHAGATIRLSKAFDVAIPVASGAPTDIATGASGEAATAVEFVISVTAVVEKGRVTGSRGGLAALSSDPQTLGGAGAPAVMAARPDETHRQAADILLEQIWRAEPGQAKFDAIDAVARKYRESDLASRNAVAWLAVTYMKDPGRQLMERWPCCYVISRCGYKPGVLELIDVLHNDSLELMRAVAAEALGGVSGDASVRDALRQAERTETSQRVRDVLAQYLGKSK